MKALIHTKYINSWSTDAPGTERIMCQESQPCVLNNPFLHLTEKESLGIITVIPEDLAWEIGHVGSESSDVIKYSRNCTYLALTPDPCI